MRGNDRVERRMIESYVFFFLNKEVGFSLERERPYWCVKHIDPALPIKRPGCLEEESDWESDERRRNKNE